MSPLSQAPIGKGYRGAPTLITEADIAAYAEATDDPSPVYFGRGAQSPPMFHVRPLRDMLFAVMEDPELGLDMLRLVHASHDARLLKPIEPGQVVVPRAILDGVEQKEKGLLVGCRLQAWTEGELAVEATSAFFIRGQQRGPVGARAGQLPAPGPAPPDRAPDQTRAVRVAPDQSFRYAEASLDRNPIHLDPVVARQGGLPDVILHGLCTMALSGRALIAATQGGDSRGLRRLAVRWSRPVHNGDALTVQIWRSPEPAAAFSVLDSEGRPVITHGWAEWS